MWVVFLVSEQLLMTFLSGWDNSINGRLIRFAGEDLLWASRAGLGIGFVGCLRLGDILTFVRRWFDELASTVRQVLLALFLKWLVGD